MFHGTFEQKLDEKGRANIPQKFRDALPGGENDRLFITNSVLRGTSECLDVYTASSWLDLEKRILERSDWDPDQLRFYIDCYLPSVQECVIDRQGRVLLPPRLREYAKLSREVLFVGVMHMFHIVNPEAWQPVFESARQVAVKDPQFVPGFNLGQSTR